MSLGKMDIAIVRKCNSMLVNHPNYRLVDWGKISLFPFTCKGYAAAIKAVKTLEGNMAIIRSLARTHRDDKFMMRTFEAMYMGIKIRHNEVVLQVGAIDYHLQNLMSLLGEYGEISDD